MSAGARWYDPARGFSPAIGSAGSRLQTACSHFGNVLYRAMRIIARNTLVNLFGASIPRPRFRSNAGTDLWGRALGLNG